MFLQIDNEPINDQAAYHLCRSVSGYNFYYIHSQAYVYTSIGPHSRGSFSILTNKTPKVFVQLLGFMSQWPFLNFIDMQDHAV